MSTLANFLSAIDGFSTSDALPDKSAMTPMMNGSSTCLFAS